MDFDDPKEFDDPHVFDDPKGIPIVSMNFDSPKVYGDTSSMVLFHISKQYNIAFQQGKSISLR